MTLRVLCVLFVTQRLERVYFRRLARGQPASQQRDQRQQRRDDGKGHRISSLHTVKLRSHLALDGLARTLTYEICAVQVGPPVLAAGGLVDRENGVVDPDLQQRIEQAMQALVAFAGAGAALCLNQEGRS